MFFMAYNRRPCRVSSCVIERVTNFIRFARFSKIFFGPGASRSRVGLAVTNANEPCAPRMAAVYLEHVRGHYL